MRNLFSILLIANLALAAYALLTPSASELDSAAVPGQLNAEQIQVIPPPSPVARSGACTQWGSFAETELEGVRRALAGAGLAERASETSVAVVAGWWVFIPPLADRAAMDRTLGQLQAMGINEYYVLDAEGPSHNAISLGIFRSEGAARAFLETLHAKGVRAARVGAREHRLMLTAVLLRDPDAQASARLAELALRFPGTELRTVDCPG